MKRDIITDTVKLKMPKKPIFSALLIKEEDSVGVFTLGAHTSDGSASNSLAAGGIRSGNISRPSIKNFPGL